MGPLVARYKSDLGVDVGEALKGLDCLRIYRCPTTGYRFFHPATLAGEGAFYD